MTLDPVVADAADERRKLVLKDIDAEGRLFKQVLRGKTSNATPAEISGFATWLQVSIEYRLTYLLATNLNLYR